MGQELRIPDSFNQGMNAAFKDLNSLDEALSDGIGQGYGVIGYKGKVWSLRYRGDRKTILRPDDGTPSGYIDVVVLGSAKTKSKSYYKAFDAGTSDGDRPICSSVDGVTPDLDVADQQSEHCAICPKNVWKRDARTGRNGRECTDYKRLAVLLMPNQTKPILNGVPLLEPVFLRVPPDSLNSLAILGDGMAAKGHHYSSFVTRITFDPSKAHPCMVFSPLQGLTAGEAPVILELRKDATVSRIVYGDAGPSLSQGSPPSRTSLAPAGTLETGLAMATSQQSSGAGTLSRIPSGNSGNQFGIGLVIDNTIDAQPVTRTPAGSGLEGLGSSQTTGFGSANIVSTVAPTPVTAEDVGEAEDSDADLDAAIASLVVAQKR